MDKVFEIKAHATQNGKNGPILCLLCYDAEEQSTILKIDAGEPQNEILRPRFGILTSEKDRLSAGDPKVIRLDSGEKGELGEDVSVVWMKWPGNTYDLRPLFSRTFEADVQWNEVALRSLGLTNQIKVLNYDQKTEWIDVSQVQKPNKDEKVYPRNRCIVFDIETNHKQIFAETGTAGSHMDVAKIPVLCIDAFDNFTTEYHAFVHTGTDKTETLVRASRILEQYRPRGIPAKAMVKLTEFSHEVDMLDAFFRYVQDRRPVALGGHNISGNQFLVSKDGRQQRLWRNGFDIPMVVKRAMAIGAEYKRLSPIEIVQLRNKEKTANEEPGLDVVISLCTPVEFIKADDYFQFTLRAEKYVDERGVHRFENKKLDTYLDYYMHCRKVNHKGSVWDLFERDWREGEYYCWGDVEGSASLYEQFQVVDKVFAYTRKYGIHPRDVFYTQKMQDHIKLDFCHGKFWLPSKFEDIEIIEEVTETLTGGHVVDSIPGLHGFTVVLDFKGLYPSIYRAFNVGRTTKVILDEVSPEMNLTSTPFARLYYSKDIISIDNQIYDFLLEDKKVASDELKEIKKTLLPTDYELILKTGEYMSTKGMINGKHGNDGNPGDRTSDRDNYNVVTAVGREALEYIVTNILEEAGYGKNVFAGDTDSVMVGLFASTLLEAKAEAEALEKIITEKIRAYIEAKYHPWNVNLIDVDCENVSDRFLVVAKKNYIKRIVIAEGEILKKPFLEWKGLKKKKHDASEACADLQAFVGESILASDKILAGKRDVELEDRIIALVNAVKTDRWRYLTPIAPINQAISKYSDSYAPIIGCKNSEVILGKKFSVGDHVHWGQFNYKGTDSSPMWLAFDDEDQEKIEKLGLELDMKHAFEGQVYGACDQILEAVGLSMFKIMNRTTGKGMMCL